MDELFVELLQITEEAAIHRERLTDEDWKTYMTKRTELFIKIRRVDAELEPSSPIRLKMTPFVQRLSELDILLLNQMRSIKDEAALHLRGIQDGRRQKQAYEVTEIMEEGFYVDKRR
ncbi:hypothetical protein [Cohnella hashimotonis]|uniref:Flagellar protein FliT n=1 Tax=Cohnella hashimotonis TaxID=2826895 RepID=A0ABT6TVW5_9BACL|nr:hypothetical protein [Cohnella hashimotonis]MDI4650363.1 hypothetical protein [Cohnella hashimotonis]